MPNAFATGTWVKRDLRCGHLLWTYHGLSRARPSPDPLAQPSVFPGVLYCHQWRGSWTNRCRGWRQERRPQRPWGASPEPCLAQRSRRLREIDPCWNRKMFLKWI